MRLLLAACLVCLVSAEPTSTTEEALIRCPRVMCEMFCESGMQTDEYGCPICKCQTNSCAENPCADGEMCFSQKCEDHPCTATGISCERLQCPMPLCESACPYGYADDKDGCMTCECKPATCENHDCPEGTVCKVEDNKPHCRVQPLCHQIREMWKRSQDPETAEMMKRMMARGHMMGHMMGSPFMGRGPHMGLGGVMNAPDCDDDGSFVPRQCSDEHCFCVDDRGLEVDGTRTPLSKGLTCQHNRTSSLHMHLTMHHNIDDFDQQVENFKQTFQEHLSHWMQIQEQSINIVEITPEEIHIISLHVVVLPADDQTDLPSAAHFFRHQVHKGLCQVPFGDDVMTADPSSMRIEHKFDQQAILPPVLPDERGPLEPRPEPVQPATGCWFRMENFYQGHRLSVILGGVAVVILLIVTIVLTLKIIKKRRLLRLSVMQPSTIPYENMDNFQKNIILSNEMDLQKEGTGKEEQAPPLEAKISIA